jgi:hypothetical protein
MALADTTASLRDTSTSLRTALETSAAALRDALDNHASRLDGLIGDVDAVARIADHPLMVAAEQVVASAVGIPPGVVEGFTAVLAALAGHAPQPALSPVEQPAA